MSDSHLLASAMNCTCVRYTDLPHISKLFADFTYHPDHIRSFYPHLPSDPGVYEAAAREMQFPPERRAALVAALRQPNGDSPQLDLLAREGTVAVGPGQQVGLFSGPAYTIYKALTAVKLARNLAAQGIPAVPIFWLATEDHDFAEVNHCWVFDAEHHPIKLEKAHSPATSQPVGQFVLSAAFGPPCSTSAGQPSAMSLKFWMKRAASVAYFWRYASRFGQVAAGSRICAGTPSHSVGTWNPNTGSWRKFAPCNLPDRAACRSVRVCRMLIRLPTPNGPPVQPVFTSQQVRSEE